MRIIALFLLASTCAWAELPDAPEAITTIRIAEAKPPIKYLSVKVNRELIATTFSFRITDALSTGHFLHDPCRCFHETQLPQGLAKNAGAMFAYSLGVAASETALSAFIWHHGEHSSHRKQWDILARSVLLADIGQEAHWTVHNYTLHPRR